MTVSKLFVSSFLLGATLVIAVRSAAAGPNPGSAPKPIHTAEELSALNEASLSLLREGRQAEALEHLSPAVAEVLGSTVIPNRSRARLLYNYGVALEANKMLREAAEAFLKARELDSSFQEPVDCIRRLTGESLAWSSPALARLVGLLLDQGDLESTRAPLQDLLRRGSVAQASATTGDELVLLARFLTAGEVGKSEFMKEWEPILAADLPHMSSAAQVQVRLLQKVYSGDVPLILDVSEGKRFTAAWQESALSRSTFASFLKMTGSNQRASGEVEAALRTYALAWSATDDVEAAVYLATILRKHSATVDPQGGILVKLLARTSEDGGVHSEGDWSNIVRLHATLASFLEDKQRWGNESDPAGVIFQLKHALLAAKRLTLDDQISQTVPSLHGRLGRAYLAVNLSAEALNEFLFAGKEYMAVGRPEASEAVLFKAAQLGEKLGDTGRKDEAKSLLDQARASSIQIPFSWSTQSQDARITESILAKLSGDPEISMRDIKVETHEGFVRVLGEVPNKADVDAMLRSAVGIQNVMTFEKTPYPRFGSTQGSEYLAAVSDRKSAADVIMRTSKNGKWTAINKQSDEAQPLAAMVGHWTTQKKLWTAPGIPPVETTGSMDVEWSTNGHYVLAQHQDFYNGVWFEGPEVYKGIGFEAQAVDGYDREQQKYVSAWVDTSGTGIVNLSGRCVDSECNSFEASGEAVNPTTGAKRPVREVRTRLNFDTLKYEYYTVDVDGKMVKVEESVARRKE